MNGAKTLKKRLIQGLVLLFSIGLTGAMVVIQSCAHPDRPGKGPQHQPSPRDEPNLDREVFFPSSKYAAPVELLPYEGSDAPVKPDAPADDPYFSTSKSMAPLDLQIFAPADSQGTQP